MKRIAADDISGRAAGEHFPELFTKDMNRLYLLSFLLTADHEKAEKCFVAGLDDCVAGSPVFREWAGSWARRIIAENAIRMLAPRINSSGAAPAGSHSPRGCSPGMSAQDAQFAGVLALEDFERFAYVLCVLERYSDQDCATLLGASRQDVRAARTRAFQQIAGNIGTSTARETICQMP